MRVRGGCLLVPLAIAAVLAGGCGTRVGNRLFTAPTTAVPATTSTTIDEAAAKAQITANWEKFFTPGLTVAQRESLLENGPQFGAALASFAGNPLATKASAVVHQVTLVPPDHATVTYDVLLSGAPALQGAAGQAVLQDGVWKVSDQSFCALVTLAGKVPGCN